MMGQMATLCVHTILVRIWMCTLVIGICKCSSVYVWPPVELAASMGAAKPKPDPLITDESLVAVELYIIWFYKIVWKFACHSYNRLIKSFLELLSRPHPPLSGHSMYLYTSAMTNSVTRPPAVFSGWARHVSTYYNMWLRTTTDLTVVPFAISSTEHRSPPYSTSWLLV